MINKRKAQITMFILVGMIILIAFGFVYYIVTQINMAKTRSGEIGKVPVEIQPVKTYIESCLDKVAKEGLDLIGKQGGYIYESQGGMVGCCNITYIDKNNKEFNSLIKEFEDYNVSYWIYASGSSGYTKFPRLEPMPITIFTQGMGFTVPASPPSIKEQLQNFTETKFNSTCTDLSSFEQFDIIKGAEPKARVDLGRYDVKFSLAWPLEIKQQEKKTKIKYFSVKENIRLKIIYSLARWLVFDDTKSIDYHLISDGNNNRYFPNIKIITKKMAGYDVIEINDNESILYGKPYKLAFIRQNRIPEVKLEIIDNTIIIEAKDADEDYLTIDNSNFEKIDNKFVWVGAPSADYSFIISDQKSERLVEVEI